MRVTKSNVQNKFVTGSVLKSLLSLMVPIMIGNLLQTAYNLTDAFWVGRLGKEAIAAVSIAFPVIFLIISLSAGIGIAGSILVSQYKGKRDNEGMSKVTGQTMVFTLFISLILAFIGYHFTPAIVKLLGAGPDVIPLAISYMKFSMIGIVFVFGYMIFQEIMRGAGDPKTPLFIVLFTVILNLVLDPLFIFGYKMIPAFGVSGAAIATICTQAIALIIGLRILKKGRAGIQLKKKHLKPDFKLIKKILKLGIPSSLEQSSRAMEMILMTTIVAIFGTTVLASYGIGMRVFSFIIIPALSLAASTGILVGQNVGAGKPVRAKKIAKLAMNIGFSGLTFIGLIFIIFANQLAAVFIPGDLEVIKITATYIRFIAVTWGFIGIQMSILGAFRGAGKTKLSMKVAMSTMLLQLVLAFTLPKITSFGINGIWMSYPISQLFGVTVSLIIFFRGKWLGKSLV